MYHLLNSYHLGTNRAIFFVQPRPYIADTEISFVNGPRKLEGIQDFFLIVDRPKDITGVCVEATLETAHLQVQKTLKARIIPISQLSQSDNKNKTAKALNLGSGETDETLEALIYGGKVGSEYYPGWNNIDASDRNAVSLLVGIGYSYETPNNTKVTKDQWKNIAEVVKRVPGLAENAAVIYERGESDTGTLFVTGRTVGSCTAHPTIEIDPRDWLIYEDRVALPDGYMVDPSSANRITEAIAGQLMESLWSPDRLAYGEANLEEASFIQEPQISVLLQMPDSDPYDVKLEEIEELDPELRRNLHDIFGVERRKEALSIEGYQLSSALGLGAGEINRLRTQLIGEGPAPNVKPGEVPVIVPNVLGIPLELAKGAVKDALLEVHEPVEQQESAKARNTVLSQYPQPGAVVAKGGAVYLVTSSGPVMVPDVVNMGLERAIADLEERSFNVKVSYVMTDAQPEGQVVATAPAANEAVPPNCRILLLVSHA